jgi:hypothetical protein
VTGKPLVTSVPDLSASAFWVPLVSGYFGCNPWQGSAKQGLDEAGVVSALLGCPSLVPSVSCGPIFCQPPGWNLLAVVIQSTREAHVRSHCLDCLVSEQEGLKQGEGAPSPREGAGAAISAQLPSEGSLVA